MTDRELMQQALDALEKYSGIDQRACDVEEALRERLAQPEQKPWVKTYTGGKPNYTTPESGETK